MTNCESMANRLNKRCDGQHEHQHVFGMVSTTDGWLPRSRCAQEYPPQLVKGILSGLLEDKEKRLTSHAVHCVLTVEALDTKDEKKVAALLRRCHENLGHPSTPRFISMLTAARANDMCIRIAKGLKCTTCQAMQGEKMHVFCFGS